MASQFTFDAIGTHWIIDISADLSVDTESLLLGNIRTCIDAFDATYSRFRADSLVTQMSEQPGVYTLPDDAVELFDVYAKLYKLTGGLVTPLIGQVLVDAGYDAEYSLAQKTALTSPGRWEDMMTYQHPQLTVHSPALLDFGAAGKGYLVDIVGRLLEENGITSYCVDAGGDILQKSEANEVLRVGLENPTDTSQAIGVANISNQSICGSAGNRRAWGDFTHIISPQTLASPRDILAVWVVADKAIIADALATGLFFVEPGILKQEYDFEYGILKADYSFIHSPHFPAEMFLQS